MSAKNAARTARTARAAKTAAVEETVKESAVKETTVKEVKERKGLTESQKDICKRREINFIMDSLKETYEGITQVEIFAYKAAKCKYNYEKDGEKKEGENMSAEIIKIRPYRGNESINITTSALWEMFNCRPKICLRKYYSNVKVVPGVDKYGYDNMDAILNSFIQISIPVKKVPYDFTDKETGKRVIGENYRYKIANVYAGKTKERMASWLESFNKITGEKELHKKYPWKDETEEIDDIVTRELSDSDDDEDE